MEAGNGGYSRGVGEKKMKDLTAEQLDRTWCQRKDRKTYKVRNEIPQSKGLDTKEEKAARSQCYLGFGVEYHKNAYSHSQASALGSVNALSNAISVQANTLTN